MSKVIEIAAMALGGLSLFAISFLAFAILSGTPIQDVAGIGALFGGSAPEEPPSLPEDPIDTPSPVPLDRTEDEIVESGIGVMGAWSLPSPYTSTELKELADELKSKLTSLELRDAHLDQRQQEIEDREGVVAERVESLERLRTELEEFQRELELRELEVIRSEKASVERDAKKWSDVAAILAELDAEVAGERLVEYPPEEAAAILRAMTTDVAASVLNAISGPRWKEYVDAYTQLQGGE